MADESNTTWWTRLIPAGTFVVGLVVGGLAVGLSHSDADAPSASPTGKPSSTSTGGDTVVTVPAACQKASTNLEKATGLLRDGVGSVTDFKPKELLALLNQLEDLDQKTRPLVKECSAVTVTTSPAPEPSAS